jgi:glycosyltransferase involved in cell wall biosynthesis
MAREIPWEKFGSLLFRERRFETALGFFERARQERKPPSTVPFDAHVLGETEGRKLFAGGRLDEAAAWYGLERRDARPLDLDPRDVLCCSVVRNEAPRLPFFLSYYRRMGVRRFFFIDNASTDGTGALLAAEPDVRLWHTAASFRVGLFGSCWFQVLLEKHAVGRWCLIVDADELLRYPDCETRSLRALAADLDAAGKKAFTAVLLDLYSDRAVAETYCRPGQDPREVCPFFDAAWFHYRHTQAGPLRNQLFVRGGVRRRVFGGEAGQVWLNKAPLVKYLPGTHLHDGQHWAHAAAAEIAEETGCLLHFKFLSTFPTYAASEAERKEHAGGASQYSCYARAMEGDPRLVLHDPAHSVRLEGDAQLIELGIMRRAAPAAGALVPRERRRGAKAHALLYTDCPRTFGAEQVNHAVAKGLAGAGHRVTVVQSIDENPLVAERRRLGIAHVWLEFDSVSDMGDGFVRAATNHAEAEHIFAAARPDVIVFADACVYSSLAARETAARLGIPFVTVVHRNRPGWWPERVPEPRAAVARALESADAVVAVCAEQLADLRGHFGLPAGKGQVIYNGRPAAFFRPRDPAVRARVRRSFDVPADCVVCLTTARLDAEKGFHYQLAAMQQLEAAGVLRKLAFVWAGSGGEQDTVPLFARFAAKARLRLLGSRSDVPDLLDGADIFVLPSRLEAFPLSVIEAMAKGVPVVATAVNGVPEALGDTGRLLPDPNRDPEAVVRGLADTIREWTFDAALRETTGAAGRERAVARFTEERMVDDYARLVAGITA